MVAQGEDTFKEIRNKKKVVELEIEGLLVPLYGDYEYKSK